MGSRSGDVDSSNWDIDNITEICNPSESLYAYLVVDSDNQIKYLEGAVLLKTLFLLSLLLKSKEIYTF